MFSTLLVYGFGDGLRSLLLAVSVVHLGLQRLGFTCRDTLGMYVRSVMSLEVNVLSHLFLSRNGGIDAKVASGNLCPKVGHNFLSIVTGVRLYHYF